MFLLAGCAQSGQNGRQATPQAAAQPASSPLVAAANAANSVVNAATGAVNGAVSGAVNGAAGGAGSTPAARRPRTKPNGRGGFDSSELQADAIRRSRLTSARYGVTKTTRAVNGVLAGQPSARPVARANR